MQTHDHTLFCGDLIAERQIEEYEDSYPEIANFEETVVRSSGRRFFSVLRIALRACLIPCAFAVHSLRQIATLIQWASSPRSRQMQKTVHPGIMLEFVVFGLFVVGAAMSTLL
jgi:hypothetical protein